MTKDNKTLKPLRMEKLKKVVLHIDESTEIEFKSDESKTEWSKLLTSNSKDVYYNRIITYARRWAKYMQYLMKKHNKPVCKIAANSSKISAIDDVSPLTYACAVAILAKYWKYGDELVKWYSQKWYF